MLTMVVPPQAEMIDLSISDDASSRYSAVRVRAHGLPPCKPLQAEQCASFQTQHSKQVDGTPSGLMLQWQNYGRLHHGELPGTEGCHWRVLADSTDHPLAV